MTEQEKGLIIFKNNYLQLKSVVKWRIIKNLVFFILFGVALFLPCVDKIHLIQNKTLEKTFSNVKIVTGKESISLFYLLSGGLGLDYLAYIILISFYALILVGTAVAVVKNLLVYQDEVNLLQYFKTKCYKHQKIFFNVNPPYGVSGRFVQVIKAVIGNLAKAFFLWYSLKAIKSGVIFNNLEILFIVFAVVWLIVAGYGVYQDVILSNKIYNEKLQHAKEISQQKLNTKEKNDDK